MVEEDKSLPFVFLVLNILISIKNVNTVLKLNNSLKCLHIQQPQILDLNPHVESRLNMKERHIKYHGV